MHISWIWIFFSKLKTHLFVCMYGCEYTIAGEGVRRQLANISSLLPPGRPGAWAQVVGLGGSCPCPLSHLTSPNVLKPDIFFKFLEISTWNIWCHYGILKRVCFNRFSSSPTFPPGPPILLVSPSVSFPLNTTSIPLLPSSTCFYSLVVSHLDF